MHTYILISITNNGELNWTTFESIVEAKECAYKLKGTNVLLIKVTVTDATWIKDVEEIYSKFIPAGPDEEEKSINISETVHQLDMRMGLLEAEITDLRKTIKTKFKKFSI